MSDVDRFIAAMRQGLLEEKGRNVVEKSELVEYKGKFYKPYCVSSETPHSAFPYAILWFIDYDEILKNPLLSVGELLRVFAPSEKDEVILAAHVGTLDPRINSHAGIHIDVESDLGEINNEVYSWIRENIVYQSSWLEAHDPNINLESGVILNISCSSGTDEDFLKKLYPNGGYKWEWWSTKESDFLSLPPTYTGRLTLKTTQES